MNLETYLNTEDQELEDILRKLWHQLAAAQATLQAPACVCSDGTEIA